MKNLIQLTAICTFILLINIAKLYSCSIVVSKCYPTRGFAPLRTQFHLILDDKDSILDIDWDFGDGSSGHNIFGFNLLKDTLITHTYFDPSPDTTKDYIPKVTIRYRNGKKCIATYSGIIIVFDKLNEKSYLVSPSSQCINGNDFCFSDTFSRTFNIYNQAKYNWDFGDGTKDSDVNMVCHSYSKTGVYNATLKLSYGEACSDSVKYKLNVLSDTSLAIAMVYNKGTVFI